MGNTHVLDIITGITGLFHPKTQHLKIKVGNMSLFRVAIEPIFNQESRPNSMLVATMVDIGLSTNKLLTNAWFETHMRGAISVINQYIIVNCVRQMLIDKSTQSVEEVLKLT